jgi:oligoribonuclease NrnB/cAMP/cGMP phosphodiesterase (DHH superfamily)
MDGKCAAAIAKKALPKEAKIKFVPMQYDINAKIPKNIWEYWRVYILDFTLSERVMDDLCTLFPREDVIWIEHHISAIQKYGDKYSHFEGIRKDSVAACELTWKFFYGNQSTLPLAVKYIADRDLWKIDDENVLFFYEWATTANTDPISSTWNFLLNNNDLKQYINRGRLLRDFRINQMKNDIMRLGYESEIDGYKCFKVNYSSYESVSDAGRFICDDLGYPVAWIYYIKKNNKGKLVKVHSLRSNGVNVSDIAIKRGGGGHKRASGFIEII